jgi:hypothetical protein
MPLYDFKCPRCGVVRESFAKYGDRTVVIDCVRSDEHPCKREQCELERQLAAPKVQVAFEHRAVCPPIDKYDGIK